jgi:hypothetical protein
MGIYRKFVLAVLLPLCLAAYCDADTRIIVRVEDYAGVTPTTLTRAEKVTARILHKAGIDIVWQNHSRSETWRNQEPPGKQERHFDSHDLRLIILSRRMALRLESDGPGVNFSLGMALPGGEKGYGSVAYIYYHRVQKLVQLVERPARDDHVILGHAVAHEIGHLLLNTAMHSASGIMHVPWDETHLVRAFEGLLVFTPAEAEQMQARFRDRLTDRNSLEVLHQHQITVL